MSEFRVESGSAHRVRFLKLIGEISRDFVISDDRILASGRTDPEGAADLRPVARGRDQLPL